MAEMASPQTKTRSVDDRPKPLPILVNENEDDLRGLDVQAVQLGVLQRISEQLDYITVMLAACIVEP